MMAAVVALVGCATFAIAFVRLGVVDRATAGIRVVRTAHAALASAGMDDDAKEAAARQAGLALIATAFDLFVRTFGALAFAGVPVLSASLLGLARSEQVVEILSRWDFILVSCVGLFGAHWLFQRHERSRAARQSDYSAVDRMVHSVAFAAPFVQLTAADIEDGMFAEAIDAVEARPPIFITSLPRAGTTVLLNAFHSLPGSATHLYRDMPFVMAPMLWAKLSASMTKPAVLRERAHGDGLKVGYDSPEAFEEVIWRAFWPEKYGKSEIQLWNDADMREEATQFFSRHFRKIIALRAGPDKAKSGEPVRGRYISKNNGNISRIPLLRSMFPEARIVVPLRDPVEQAASLLRQHRNFVHRHSEDPFTLRYMRDIGHLEFGAAHTSFAFNGFRELAGGVDLDQPDYWLAYWIAAYRHIAANADDVVFVDHDALASDGQAVMERLTATLGADVPGTQFGQFFSPVPRRADIDAFGGDLKRMAADLHAELISRAI